MYITLTGTYKDGKVLLVEEVPSVIKEAKVLVTLLQDINQINELKHIVDAWRDPSANSD